MDRLRLSLWLWIAAALMALGLSAPAAAAHRDGAVVTSRCHAHSDADRTAEAMIAARAWNCTGAGWKADAPVAWLRFDATDWRGGPVPQHFFSRTSRRRLARSELCRKRRTRLCRRPGVPPAAARDHPCD
jgi:hypothetical protein